MQAREDFGGLRLTADGSMSYLLDHVNQRSKLVQVASADPANFPLTTVANAAGFPSTPDGGWLKLAGGDDAIASLSPDDFVGVDGGSGKRTGIASLEDIDEISMCLAPGMWSASVQSALIIHCESLKDRFAVLDPQDGLSIEGIRTFREPLDTKYAALYYPWVEVRDPSRKRNVEVGPSAHMAGVYARVDVERGVHKAPANEVIRGITRIAQDVTKREHDMLNPKNINVLRYFRRGLEVCQRAAPVHLCRGVDRRGHAMGGVRAERRAAVGARTPDHQQLPDVGVAFGRAARRQGR